MIGALSVPSAALLGACGGSRTESPSAGAKCTLYPAETEGPFYVNLDLVRTNITEGKQGLPLALAIRVMSSTSCKPLANVAVDIWHCDAGGVYSGYPGQLGGTDTTGQKFLRGTQLTDALGRAQFDTIYPGWYPGRTTHIHFKVHTSSTSEATSQLYFPEDVTSLVYQSAPYVSHGQKDTTNVGDSVTQGNVPPLLVLQKNATGYAATLDVAVA